MLMPDVHLVRQVQSKRPLEVLGGQIPDAQAEIELAAPDPDQRVIGPKVRGLRQFGGGFARLQNRSPRDQLAKAQCVTRSHASLLTL